MRLYTEESVLDAALRRINWLFDEFEHVVVAYSGGKDSTVAFWLTLMVAEQRGRLPLSVFFLDQEAEYAETIRLVNKIMRMPEVRPFWYQIPFRLFNSNSIESDWLYCWGPEDEHRWMRPKADISIKENVYGSDRFKDILAAIQLKDFGDSVAIIGGVRCEESPTRLLGLTGSEVYKGETWGKIISRKRDIYVFYPLYDWSYTDIWKAIHEYKWEYSKIYDKQFSLGVTIPAMRVSSLCHEVSSAGLCNLQEFEKETWEKLTNRLSGIETSGNMKAGLVPPKKLPFMFSSWKEYRDYLLENLLPEGVGKEKIRKRFENFDKKYDNPEYWGVCVATVLNNDHYFTKLDMFRARYKGFDLPQPERKKK